MHTPEDIAREKAALRSTLRAARRAATPAQRAQWRAGWAASAERIADLAGGTGTTIAAYLPAEGEPDPTLAMHAWHALGLSVLVPLSLPDRVLRWARWSPEIPVSRGRYAPVPEPVGAPEASAEEIDLVVVPALAVADDGRRLGQGGGYYDSFLSGLGVPTLACVGPSECLERVPHDDWDAVLDAAWTPAGVSPRPVGRP